MSNVTISQIPTTITVADLSTTSYLAVGDGADDSTAKILLSEVKDYVSGNRGVIIRDGDDVQAILDSYTARSVTLLPAENVTFSAPLVLGNSTAIVGENPNLTTQGASIFYPRHVLDFSASAINGLETDADSLFRCQRILLDKIVLKGSADNNAKTGIKLIDNAGEGHPGLFTTREIYIESFQTGIDENTLGDSSDHRDTHIQKFNVGFANVNQQTVLDHPDLWWATGSAAVGVSITGGGQNIICNGEFALGDSSAATPAECVNSTHITIAANSSQNKIYGNTFDFKCSKFISSAGSNNVISGNTFTNTGETIANIASLGASDVFASNVIYISGGNGAITSDGIVCNAGFNVISGNSFRGLQTTTKTCILLNSSNNIVIGNTFNNCNPQSNVKIGATYTDNILIGDFPDGVEDLGVRTIINGISKNNGAPAVTGNWNGQAALAYAKGVMVENYAVNPSEFFKADSYGNWTQIG